MSMYELQLCYRAVQLHIYSLSSSLILTVAVSGDPVTIPMLAASCGISRSRKNSLGNSATRSFKIGTLKLTIFTPGGKNTENGPPV